MTDVPSPLTHDMRGLRAARRAFRESHITDPETVRRMEDRFRRPIRLDREFRRAANRHGLTILDDREDTTVRHDPSGRTLTLLDTDPTVRLITNDGEGYEWDRTTVGYDTEVNLVHRMVRAWLLDGRIPDTRPVQRINVKENSQ